MVELTFRTSRVEINGQVIDYEDIFSPSLRITAIEEDDAHELFHRTKELFDEAGIKFSLVFGSLLGAVREGKSIKGDQDLDICVWDEEHLRDNLFSLNERGLKVCRIIPGMLYSFRINMSCYIDVYILGELRGILLFPWRLYCVSLAGYETPRKFFTGWREIEFFGEKCMCPEKPERLLEFWYGTDWRIPSDTKGRYRVASAEWVHKLSRFIFNRSYRKMILTRKKLTGSFFKKG